MRLEKAAVTIQDLKKVSCVLKRCHFTTKQRNLYETALFHREQKQIFFERRCFWGIVQFTNVIYGNPLTAHSVLSDS